MSVLGLRMSVQHEGRCRNRCGSGSGLGVGALALPLGEAGVHVKGALVGMCAGVWGETKGEVGYKRGHSVFCCPLL